MKKHIKQLTFASAAPRNIMFVEYEDGTFRVFEDDEQALKAYRAKRGERTSTHRAFVRRAP